MYNKVKTVISLKQGQSRVGRRSMDVTDGVTGIVGNDSSSHISIPLDASGTIF